MISFKISKYWSPSSPKVWIPKCMLLSRVVHYLSPGCESALCMQPFPKTSLHWLIKEWYKWFNIYTLKDKFRSLSGVHVICSKPQAARLSWHLVTQLLLLLSPCASASSSPAWPTRLKSHIPRTICLCRIDLNSLNRNNKNQKHEQEL